MSAVLDDLAHIPPGRYELVVTDIEFEDHARQKGFSVRPLPATVTAYLRLSDLPNEHVAFLLDSLTLMRMAFTVKGTASGRTLHLTLPREDADPLAGACRISNEDFLRVMTPREDA